MTLLHIYRPQADEKKIQAGKCLDCKKPTWFIAFHTLWHGWDSTCIRCGRRWCDGEWMRLDFVRGARQKSVDAAKRRWRGMTK